MSIKKKSRSINTEDNFIEGYLPYILGGALIGAVALNYFKNNNHFSFATTEADSGHPHSSGHKSSSGGSGGNQHPHTHTNTQTHSQSHRPSSHPQHENTHSTPSHHITTTAAAHRIASPLTPTHNAVHKVTHPATSSTKPTTTTTTTTATAAGNNTGIGFHEAYGFGHGGGGGGGGFGGSGSGFHLGGGFGPGSVTSRGGAEQFGHDVFGDHNFNVQGFGHNHHHSGDQGGVHNHDSNHGQHGHHHGDQGTSSGHNHHNSRQSQDHSGTTTGSEHHNNREGGDNRHGGRNNRHHHDGSGKPLSTETSGWVGIKDTSYHKGSRYTSDEKKNNVLQHSSFEIQNNTQDGLYKSTGNEIPGSAFATDINNRYPMHSKGTRPSYRHQCETGCNNPFTDYEYTSVFQVGPKLNEGTGGQEHSTPRATIEFAGGPQDQKNNNPDYNIGFDYKGHFFVNTEGTHKGGPHFKKITGDQKVLINDIGPLQGRLIGYKGVIYHDKNKNTHVEGWVSQDGGPYQKFYNLIQKGTRSPWGKTNKVQQVKVRVDGFPDTKFNVNGTSIKELDLSGLDKDGNLPLYSGDNTSSSSSTTTPPTPPSPPTDSTSKTQGPPGNIVGKNTSNDLNPLTSNIRHHHHQNVHHGGHHNNNSETPIDTLTSGGGTSNAIAGGQFFLNHAHTNNRDTIRPPMTSPLSSQNPNLHPDTFFNFPSAPIPGSEPLPYEPGLQQRYTQHPLSGEDQYQYISSNLATQSTSTNTDNTTNLIAMAAIVGIPLVLLLALF